MEPFLIRCPTCRCGLRVRRPEIIGQIIGCPKCSGMVLVARPGSESSPNQSAANGQTTVLDEAVPRRKEEQKQFESTCDQIDELLESPAANANATATEAPKERWRNAKPRTTADRSMIDAHACGQPYSETEMAPSPDWALKKKRSGGLRQALVFIVATAVIGITAWALRHRAPTMAESLAANASAVTRDQPEEAEGAKDEDVSRVAAPLSVADAAETDPKVAFASHRNESPSQAVAAPVDHEQPISSDDLSDDLNSDAEPATTKTDQATDAKLKPLNNFGELFDDLEDDEATAASPGGTAPTRPTSAARPQRELTVRNLRLPDHLHARFKPRKAKVRNDALPSKPVDVQARLKDPIEDVRINVGLDETLRYVSSMSTIPFTIRPEALRYSRITPDTRTPVAAAKTTVAELLSKGLAAHSLDIKAVDGHVIIDRKKAARGQITTNSHNVADLINAGVLGPELTSLVKQLIDPFSWNALETPVEVFVQDDLLVMRQSESAHFETMFLLERLRVARGMSLRGTMDRTEFTNDWQRTAELTQPVALRTKRIDSLGSVIQKLDQLAGNEHHVMADWQSLYEQGWISISPFSAEIARQPLASALNELLNPLGLTHRCVGPKLIEITTRTAESQRSEIGFHSIGALTQAGYDPETVVRQVEQTIGERVFRRGGGKGVIVYNDGAQSILVRLPQSQQAAVDWVIKELERTL